MLKTRLAISPWTRFLYLSCLRRYFVAPPTCIAALAWSYVHTICQRLCLIPLQTFLDIANTSFRITPVWSTTAARDFVTSCNPSITPLTSATRPSVRLLVSSILAPELWGTPCVVADNVH